MKRREFLALGGASAALAIVGCGEQRAPSGPPVATSLPIPTLLSPTEIEGVQHYDLTVQKGTRQIFTDVETRTYAINGSYLGPTLLMKNGDSISVNYQNDLSETITMHGHGLHVPPRMDGSPHQRIAAGDGWSATYTLAQKACTCWYHPHTMDETAPQVYKGLAGLIIIEDEESRTLDLPRRYGEDDIPLVLQDRYFDAGQFDYDPSRMEIMRGYVGDTLLANGAIEPSLDLEAKQIRFRILNGSNSSVYELAFSDQRQFHQIATDNAFLETPVELTSLILSPGERAEIILDLTASLGDSFELRELRSGDVFVSMKVERSATETTVMPETLTTLEKLKTADARSNREFRFTAQMMALKINGKSMDIDFINERVPLDEVEIWEVKNEMRVDHNFHIHATHFMILDRNGSVDAVKPNERGYKDVVYVPGGESVRFIVKMTDYSDETVPYMYHCHFLEHEDAGMMGQFLVV